MNGLGFLAECGGESDEESDDTTSLVREAPHVRRVLSRFSDSPISASAGRGVEKHIADDEDDAGESGAHTAKRRSTDDDSNERHGDEKPRGESIEELTEMLEQFASEEHEAPPLDEIFGNDRWMEEPHIGEQHLDDDIDDDRDLPRQSEAERERWHREMDAFRDRVQRELLEAATSERPPRIDEMLAAHRSVDADERTALHDEARLAAADAVAWMPGLAATLEQYAQLPLTKHEATRRAFRARARSATAGRVWVRRRSSRAVAYDPTRVLLDFADDEVAKEDEDEVGEDDEEGGGEFVSCSSGDEQ